MNKDEIKKLIANGKIEKAIDKIILHVNTIADSEDKNDFILQSSRFKRIIREKRLGIETAENINITINQITSGILSILDSLETKSSILPSEKNNPQIKTKNNKKLVIYSAIICLITFGIITHLIFFNQSMSISRILEKSDFAQTSPPNKLIGPGTIALIEEGQEGILKIICPCENAFGDSISHYFVESPSTNIDFSNRLNGNFIVDLSFLERFTFKPNSSNIKKINLKLSNVKIIELPEDAIFKNINKRTLYCSQAITNRLNSGKKVTLIKRVIQADAEYSIEFSRRLSLNDSLDIIKSLALELTGSTETNGKNKIIGKNLYWGVDDDVVLGSLKPNELPATGSSNRPRLTKSNKSYRVEFEQVSYDLNPIKQPTDMSCWISVYTMMLSWKNKKKYEIKEVIDSLGEPWKSYYLNDVGLPASEVEDFLKKTSLNFEYPSSYTLETYEKWLKETGPVWIISGDGISSHAKLLIGIFGDNNGEFSIFEFIDPATGETQRMEMLDFITEYEREAHFLNNMEMDIPFRIQIIHF